MKATERAGVVIVGSGVAGAQAALDLRRRGFDGRVTLVGEELHSPYQRPPLSKGFLAGDAALESLYLGDPGMYAEREIELIRGIRATAIDRPARQLLLEGRKVLTYEHLILATGSRNRLLPAAGEAVGLRTIGEAEAIAQRLHEGQRITIIGGGFIGLEVASLARERGAEVTVVELLDRLLVRSVSATMAEFLRTEHEGRGTRVLLGRKVVSVEGSSAVLDDGEVVDSDLVVVGIGVVPRHELAESAGLEVDDGILVDEYLLTLDPRISAVGDCARYACAANGEQIRLEAFQSALDQARYVAGRLTGSADRYEAVPSFWTEQLGMRLQIAGAAASDQEVIRGDPSERSFSVCCFALGELVAVESLDRRADHTAARKLLARPAPRGLTPEQAEDTGVDLAALGRPS